MAENERFGREPIEVVQIDQDFCNLTYGVLPCIATPFANLTEWSENFDNADTFSYTFDRLGTNVGPDGLVYQEMQINHPDDSGVGVIAYNRKGYLVLDGRASFHIRFKKTAYSANLEVEIETTVNLGFGVVGGANNVTVDSSTGAIVSELEFGYFVNVATVTVDGDYVDVRLEIEADAIDPDVNETEFGNLIRLTSNEGDIIEIGRVQSGPSEFTETYVRTEGDERHPTGSSECFNTRSTCQDPQNYDRGVLPLKFVDKRSPLPKDDYYIPSLTSVSVTPAKLNPGGANRNASALGERASVNLTFLDHPHNDRMVDKYRANRDYDPKERGTFWTKWRARNPYYMQRPITLRTGYLKDGNIVDEITRAFVITGFSGPDNQGRVQIKGKDVLTLAEDSKAQAPNVSTGRLSADISAGSTSLTLTPAGIGNDEYGASGFVRINKEVMAFTRSGDNMTLTRAQFGTEAQAHDEDDTVQQCLRYESEAPQDILYDFLRNYAGIPDVYLDKAGWDAEALDYLPRLYSAIISEPEGVSKLISEMCQQMYFTIWFDERESLVKLRAVRLAENDEVFELDDNMHLIENSISWKDLSDELITQVWVYYGQSNPTEKLDQGDNYVAVSVTVDPLAEGPNKHNLRRIKKIFSRWIDAANAGAAEDLGRRILNRYGNAPREVSFRVDAKDNYLWLGDFVRLTNRLRVDRFGLPTPVNIQLFQAQESSLGSEFQFTGQEFIPALTDGDEVEDPNIRTIPITSDFLNVNLRTLHDSQFGEPTGTETITFIIRSGVTIGGYAAGGGTNVQYEQRNTLNDFYSPGTSLVSGLSVGQVPILQRNSIGSFRQISKGSPYESLGDAFYDIQEYPVSLGLTTGDWPAGVTLKLVVEAGARVVGEGGNGSAHVTNSFSGSYESVDIGTGDRPLNGVPGGDGGDAIQIDYPIEITNGGVIAAGGGGGGSAAFIQFNNVGFFRIDYTYGGGGAGLEISDVKNTTSQFNDDPNRISVISQRNPSAGSITSGSTGGRQNLKFANDANAIKTSGRGGNLAGSGSGGSLSIRIGSLLNTTASSTGTTNYTLSQGGQPGKAIRSGANLITWVNKGDVRGQEVN